MAKTGTKVEVRQQICRDRNVMDNLVDRFRDVGLTASAVSVVQASRFTTLPPGTVTMVQVMGRRSGTIFSVGFRDEFPVVERGKVTPRFLADCDEISYIVAQWKEAGWQ